ncbi:30S ribosomal protein THX [Parapedobacter soli]|nr:30S ribosomal protein THX [Parapedobacter soli]
MGKGDKKTKRGKIVNGTYGRRRQSAKKRKKSQEAAAKKNDEKSI